MKKGLLFRFLIVIVFCILLISPVSAQDTHYWNLQYGTSSNLLGGAVIGSVLDMAATYYNPAALSLFETPQILLSGKVYQVSEITVDNGSDLGEDLNYSKMEPAPTLFAGSFTFSWLGDNNTLSYSILTRQRMNYAVEGRRGGVNETESGEELVAGELISNQELSDLWLGLSWSAKLSSTIAFGITPYLSVRDQKTYRHVYGETLDPVGNVDASIITQQFEYRNYRILAKAGIGAIFDRLTMGLTLTTPTLSVGGSGSSLINLVQTGDASDEETTFIANYQQDVDAQHRLPLALGFGAGYKLGKHRLHFSSEWYDKVSNYKILDTQPFTGQSNGVIYHNSIDAEAKSVLNYGFGLEFYLNDQFNFYASYTTDFSSYVPESNTSSTISTWDIYHLSGGASFAIGKSEFTLGINFAFGSGDLENAGYLPESESTNSVSDALEGSELEYRRLKFSIGFSFEI